MAEDVPPRKKQRKKRKFPAFQLPKESLEDFLRRTDQTVVIPKGASTKEAKKLRKQARRKAKAEGRDETKIKFVVEGEDRPTKKKKRSFPSINEMVEQQKQARERLAQSDIDPAFKAKYIALDCEMVGIGKDGRQSVLARVSIVDWDGDVVLDTFVKVATKVTDFRTWVSGVKPKHLKSDSAMELSKVQEKVAGILKGKILVGHALQNDMHALMLQHSPQMTRDTAKYRPFQRYHKKWRPRKLRDLVREFVGESIQQEGQSHDSVEDARATMDLFKTVCKQWEEELELSLSKKK